MGATNTVFAAIICSYPSDNGTGTNSSEENGPILSKERIYGAVQCISEDAKLRKCFCDFVRKGDWHEKVSLTSLKAVLMENAQVLFNEIVIFSVGDYRLPCGCALRINSHLSNKTLEQFSLCRKTVSEVEMIEITKSTALRSLLIASVFPWFLASHEFRSFIYPKSNSNQLLSSENEIKSTIKDGMEATANLPVENLVDDKFTKILVKRTWMSEVNMIIDSLPQCVTIASTNTGFPLVYVNTAFLELTGYEKEDILGYNCRFLQSDKTEKEQVRKISQALRKAQPLKIGLTNCKKDGSSFFNMLALQPVFDMQGHYTFVIGIQYDIGHADASSANINRVNYLLEILPNLLL